MVDDFVTVFVLNEMRKHLTEKIFSFWIEVVWGSAETFVIFLLFLITAVRGIFESSKEFFRFRLHTKWNEIFCWLFCTFRFNLSRRGIIQLTEFYS